VILRGKEWQEGEAVVNGGVLVWILYAPEDGSADRCVDGWIPFQMKWDLPDEIPDGKLRVQCQLRCMDGRSVSPRKMIVRCGISARAEGSVPAEIVVTRPAGESETMQLLENTYPIRITREAGEKVFLLDEELTFPDSEPAPDRIIYCRMEPQIMDVRVLGDKLAFRGNGNLYILYCSEEGSLHRREFPVVFSQIAELEQEYGADAQADMIPAVTNLEGDLDDEGHFRLKCGMTAQYAITERHMICAAEDAYCPGREVLLKKETLEFPVILEHRRETVSGEQPISVEGDKVVDVSFLPDFPRERREGQQSEMRYPGNLQILYYGNDGTLQSSNIRWEGKQKYCCDEACVLQATLLPGETQVMMGSGQLQIKAELPVDMTTTTRQRIQMVTDVEPGAVRKLDPDRPTLILRRAGENRLWDIAKSCDSTVEEIRKANGLQGEPAPGQMLLIPLC
jgi:hypothetical protein